MTDCVSHGLFKQREREQKVRDYLVGHVVAANEILAPGKMPAIDAEPTRLTDSELLRLLLASVGIQCPKCRSGCHMWAVPAGAGRIYLCKCGCWIEAPIPEVGNG